MREEHEEMFKRAVVENVEAYYPPEYRKSPKYYEQPLEKKWEQAKKHSSFDKVIFELLWEEESKSFEYE